MSKSYLLVVLLLSIPAKSLSLSPFGDVGAEVIRWFGTMPIDATKTPVIFIKANLPSLKIIAKKAMEKAASKPEAVMITAAGVSAAAAKVVELKIAEAAVDGGVQASKAAYNYVKKELSDSKNVEDQSKKETIETTQVGL